MLSFVEYLSQFANQHNSIAFKMIDGETQFSVGNWPRFHSGTRRKSRTMRLAVRGDCKDFAGSAFPSVASAAPCTRPDSTADTQSAGAVQ